MPRKIDPSSIQTGAGTVPARTVDDSAFKYPERDVDPLRVHLHDPSRAHMASAIGIVDAADCYTSDEVEGALQEICSGMGAGRMNGLVEGGYIARIDGVYGSYYPNGGTGLEVTLVAPTDPSGHPSTALIRAHTLDLSGATFDFATGTDPVGGAPTSVAGTYYLYVETDSASPSYETLVASTTLPAVADEQIHIAQVTHDGANITGLVDTRYFVANLDRKLPYTLRSGNPTEFVSENADTWGEALFQTLEAALWWVSNYGGAGNTQEEKATIIVRGLQQVSQQYTLPTGVHLQGSGPDAEIRYTGNASPFLTVVGDDVRLSDLKVTIEQDIGLSIVAIAAVVNGALNGLRIERCRFYKTDAVDWDRCVDLRGVVSASERISIVDSSFDAQGTILDLIPTSGVEVSSLRIVNCDLNGVSTAAEGIRIPGGQGCEVLGNVVANGVNTSSIGIRLDANTSNSTGIRIVGNTIAAWTIGTVLDGGGTVFSDNYITLPKGATENGIMLYGDDGVVNAAPYLVSGNTVSTLNAPADFALDTSPYAIALLGNVAGARVVDNRVQGNWYNSNVTSGPNRGGSIGLSAFGAPSTTPTDAHISGNVLSTGIVLEAGSTDIRIEGNSLSTTGNGVPQILIPATCINIVVSGNQIDGLISTGVYADSGIYVRGDESNGVTRDVSIVGNTVRNHASANIHVQGHTHGVTIADNTVLNDFSENIPATGIGIHLEAITGNSGKGSPRGHVVSGNTVTHRAHGIVLEGVLGDTVVDDRYVVSTTVSSNNVRWCARDTDQTLDQSDWDTTFGHGIAVVRSQGITVSDNQVFGTGNWYNPTTNATVATANNSYPVGIHVVRCEKDVVVTDNQVINTTPNGVGFALGIHDDVAPNEPNTGITPSRNQYIRHTIANNHVAHPGRSLAGITVWGANTFQTGLGIGGSVLVDQFEVRGNTINASGGTSVADLTAAGVGYGGDYGGCGVLVAIGATQSLNGVQSKVNALSVEGNVVDNYAAKGIAFRVTGAASGGGLADNVIAQGIRIHGNEIGSAVGPATYVDETTPQNDAGVLALVERAALLQGLDVADNLISGPRQCGICVGTATVAGGSQAYTTEIRVRGNTILTLDDSAGDYGGDTFGVKVRNFGAGSRGEFGAVFVSDNMIGPVHTGITGNIGNIVWGVFMQTPSTDPAELDEGSGCRGASVVGNEIVAGVAGITLNLYNSGNTVAEDVKNIRVNGNTTRSPHNPGYGGNFFGATWFTRVAHVGLMSAGNSVLNIDMSGNTTGIIGPEIPDPAGLGRRGVALLASADGITLGSETIDIAISGNTLQAFDGPASVYAVPGVDIQTGNMSIRNLAVRDNQGIGGASIVCGWGNDVVPIVEDVAILDNRWTGITERIVNARFTPSTYSWSHMDDSGVRRMRISGNTGALYHDGGDPNESFAIRTDFINMNVRDLQIAENQIDARDTDGGGIRVRSLLEPYYEGITISRNQVRGGAKPAIWWDTRQATAVPVSGLRIEDNECTDVQFPDGGWGAGAGIPDAVILYAAGSSDLGSTPLTGGGHGENDISISGNRIDQVLSDNPTITDSESLLPGNAAIYFGPRDTLNYNGGADFDNDEHIPNIRSIRIDRNIITQTNLRVGIYLNALPTKVDVNGVSVSGNIVGKSTTHVGVVDPHGRAITPRIGIRLRSKYPYKTDWSSNEGVMGVRNVSVNDNDIFLTELSTVSEGDGTGIQYIGITELDFASDATGSLPGYTGSNISVSRNRMTVLSPESSEDRSGITFRCQHDADNVSLTENEIHCPTYWGTDTDPASARSGIRFFHEWRYDEGLELAPVTNNPDQVAWDGGLGFRMPARSYNTGGTDRNMWRIGVVFFGLPDSRDAKSLMWRNIHIENNTASGRFGMPLTPLAAGATMQEAGISFSNLTKWTAFGTTDRGAAQVPAYNVSIRGNTARNDYDQPEGLIRSIRGFYIGWTEGLAAAGLDRTQDASSYQRGWVIVGNSASAYSQVEYTSAATYADLDGGVANGFDVYLDDNGTLSDALGNTQMQLSGICTSNYCAQLDNDGNPNPIDLTDRHEAGWALRGNASLTWTRINNLNLNEYVRIFGS
jgi:hypothetical protein